MSTPLFRVVGVGPDGQREVGVARPRDEALRIFAAVLASRPADFHPHANVRLVVEPVSVEGEINGTYPTPVRLKLVAAIQEPGRIYGEAGEVWDKATGFKVTRRVGELVAAQWIEAVPRDGYRDDWSPQRTYFRPADNEFGKAVSERSKR